MAKNSSSFGEGPSQRQLRVGEVVRRALSEMLMRGEIHDPDLNRMSITISEVRVSPDLRVGTVFIMPLGGKNPEEAVKAMARNKGEMKRLLGKTTTLRFMPDLRFILDESFDRMEETRRLLSNEQVRRDVEADGDEEE